MRPWKGSPYQDAVHVPSLSLGMCVQEVRLKMHKKTVLLKTPEKAARIILGDGFFYLVAATGAGAGSGGAAAGFGATFQNLALK